MAALKVEIISRETIKPSPPTPAHKTIHPLTLLDQTAPAVYIPLCLFYPNAGDLTTQLKASLSRALAIYYPLAGRYTDAAAATATTLQCNDRGVDFLEARAPCPMAHAIHHHPDLLPLLPCLPRQRHNDPDGELTLLALQLTSFDCGGVAIGICLWHRVADACTLLNFLREWSRINNNGGGPVDEKNDVVRDLTSLFPPRDPSTVGSLVSRMTAAVTGPNTTTKRFVFEGPKIEALRLEIEKSHSPRPTRVEAVSALIWAAVIRISRPKLNHSSSGTTTDDCYSHVAMRAINLRTRMDPQIPEQVMANSVIFPTLVEWEDPVEAADDDRSSWHGVLAGKLRDVVVMVDDGNARNLLGSYDDDDDVFLDIFRVAVDAYEKGDMLVMSSWCRFPFYDETDFGWGKPVWLGFYTFCHNSVVLIDAKDGEGIEAWVALSPEGMSEFVNSPAILRYVSCKPPVVIS